MRITIVGHKGQLGEALQTALAGEELQLLDLPEYDMTAYPAATRVIEDYAPDMVLLPAAMTDVDGCETKPELAFRVNALGARNVALACQTRNTPLLLVSTDYVFGDNKREPRYEYDRPDPQCIYARSKLAGEQIIRDLLSRFYIVRTAWLYDRTHRNFVNTIKRLSSERDRLKMVTTEEGSPTYAPELAAAITKLIHTSAYGIYHFTNSGVCSRYQWARKIMDLLGRSDYDIEPTDSYPRPAQVPAFVELKNSFGAALGITLRPWEEALEECLRDR
jgi:dTDP-4-dehydrorhamnose reductase